MASIIHRIHNFFRHSMVWLCLWIILFFLCLKFPIPPLLIVAVLVSFFLGYLTGFHGHREHLQDGMFEQEFYEICDRIEKKIREGK